MIAAYRPIRVARNLLVGIFRVSFFPVLHIVLRISEISPDGETHLFCYFPGIAYIPVSSVAFHFSHVSVRQRYQPGIIGHLYPLHKNAVTPVPENVGNKRNMVVKKAPLDTDIGFYSLLPFKVIGADSRFAHPFNTCRPPGTYGAAVYKRQVREPARTDPVVSYRSIRSSDLQKVKPRQFFFDKLVVRRDPSQCNRRKKAILAAWLEVFRSGIPKVEINHVGILEPVSKPARNSLVPEGNRIQVGCPLVGRFLIAHIIINKSRYMMIFSEHPVIIDGALQVIFPVLIGRFPIGNCSCLYPLYGDQLTLLVSPHRLIQCRLHSTAFRKITVQVVSSLYPEFQPIHQLRQILV